MRSLAASLLLAAVLLAPAAGLAASAPATQPAPAATEGASFRVRAFVKRPPVDQPLVSMARGWTYFQPIYFAGVGVGSAALVLGLKVRRRVKRT